MENFCREYLLSLAKTFAKAEGLSLTYVSRRFHGGVWFLDQFRKGEVTLTLRKFDEMVDRFAAEWPTGLKFPESSLRLKRNSVKK